MERPVKGAFFNAEIFVRILFLRSRRGGPVKCGRQYQSIQRIAFRNTPNIVRTIPYAPIERREAAPFATVGAGPQTVCEEFCFLLNLSSSNSKAFIHNLYFRRRE